MSTQATTPTVDQVAAISRIIDDEKGEQILALDVRGICNFTDYFVICNGLTRPHQRKIGQTIQLMMKDAGYDCASAVGYNDTDWVALDFHTIVVHIFTNETREYYSLERLWGDAETIDWQAANAPKSEAENSEKTDA